MWPKGQRTQGDGDTAQHLTREMVKRNRARESGGDQRQTGTWTGRQTGAGHLRTRRPSTESALTLWTKGSHSRSHFCFSLPFFLFKMLKVGASFPPSSWIHLITFLNREEPQGWGHLPEENMSNCSLPKPTATELRVVAPVEGQPLLTSALAIPSILARLLKLPTF